MAVVMMMRNVIRSYALYSHRQFLLVNSINLRFRGLFRLCDEGHYAADKIHKKAANLEERRKNNHTKANDQLEKANDSLQLHQYLQVDDVMICMEPPHLTIGRKRTSKKS